MFRRARRVGREGFRRFSGTPEEICRQIIERCWDADKRYFRVSSGHFAEFYVRDFAHTAAALVALGYGEKVKATLQYALRVFARHGRIEQSISPSGKPFSFPAYSPDALALLLYAMVITNNIDLAKRHRTLLQAEADRFAQTVVDPATLLPYRHKRFSGMRDHAKRQGACYDAVMIGLVAKYAPMFGIKFPYTHREVARRLVETYWQGGYFFSDLQKQPLVTGDANVFPFWTGVLEGAIPKKELAAMRRHAMDALHNNRLDNPWPLRYVSPKDVAAEKVRLSIGNLFAGDYQTHSIWMNIGLCMLDVLWGANPELASTHSRRIGELISQHGTFLEVYDRTGEPFKTPWYVTDEAMLWCAQWLRRAV